MADFEEYGEIISRCMGNKENEFLQTYQYNIGDQVDEAIEANPLSTVLFQFMNECNVWEGTASQLLSILNDFAEIQLKMTISKIQVWPKSPNKLSGSLNEVKTNLREKNIIIEKYKDKKGNKIIKISKISSESSNRPNSEIQAENPTNNFADTPQSIVKVPSKEIVNNQTQSCTFDDIDDKDDNLRMLVSNNTSNTTKISQENNSLSYTQLSNDIEATRNNMQKTIEITSSADNKLQLCKCNYCPAEFCTSEEHLKHCINNHSKKPAQPNKELIKTMQENGEKVELKGNLWELKT